MCSAIFLRMTDIGAISTRSPGRKAGTAWTIGDWDVGVAAGGPVRVSRCSRMSRLVTRPAMPVPCSCLRSTWCSWAMRLTSGDDRVRRSSSRSSSGDLGPAGGSGAGRACSCAGAWPSGCAIGEGGAGTGGPGTGATCSPSWAITATTLSTGTVSPSFTRISASRPATGEGISASTLSVEISNNGSSRSTASPIFLIQRTSVPSATDSPIWGITTLVGMGNPSGTDADSLRGLPPADRQR